MRTITAVPVIALVGGLAAGVAHADDPPPPATWTATPAEPRAQTAAAGENEVQAVREQAVMLLAQRSADDMGLPRATGKGDGQGNGGPTGAVGNVWGVLSAAEREARAIVDSERGISSKASTASMSSTAIPQVPAEPAASAPGSHTMPPTPVGSELAAPQDGQPARTDRTDPAPAIAPAIRQPRAGHGAGGGRVDVGQLALSTLARHAARAMGQDNARVLGLDAIAPTVEPAVAFANARPPWPAAPRSRTVAFQPDPVRDGGLADEVPSGARAATRPRHAQLALAPPNARLASAYDDLIDEVARRHDVAPHLIRAVIKVESNFQPHARSPKGALGLMQVMPATGRRFGAVDLRDPRSNLSAGTQYLRWLLNRFDEDLTLALAAYNAGEGAVEKYGRRIPPFAETQGYVSKVLAHLGLTPATGATASPASPTSGGDARGSVTADAGPTSTIPSRADDGSGPKAGRPARLGGNANAARQQADATLRTVSNWIGALLTSSSQPQPQTRAATNGAAAKAPAMATDPAVDASSWAPLPASQPVRTGPV